MKQSRRRFVGQCAAVVGTSAVSALAARIPLEARQTEALLNWAGNYRYSTNRVTSATSLAEVQAFVRQHERFKVLGTRHCFNGIADSADAFLSLRESQFGPAYASALLASVPEPSSLTCLLAGTLLLAPHRRRRHRAASNPPKNLRHPPPSPSSL